MGVGVGKQGVRGQVQKTGQEAEAMESAMGAGSNESTVHSER